MFDNHILKATESEISFYEDKLYPLQDEIFKLVQTERFYLSGGTCLSRFYYQHRYSEDLDFFFDGFLYPKEEFVIVFREIINRISEEFQIEITLDGEYFKRGFIYQEEAVLKLKFKYDNYKNIGERLQSHDIWIDSKENIVTNKLTAIYDRKTIKDFVDLYYLLQEYPFEQVAEWALYKIIPMDYEGVFLSIGNRELEGSALMKKDISPIDFSEFVINLGRKMLDYAKKSG